MRTTVLSSGLLVILFLLTAWLGFYVSEQAVEAVKEKNITEDLTRLAGRNSGFPTDLTNKKLVINLWASWCQPCIAEIPELNRIVRNSSDSTIQFIAVSTDFERKAEDFLEQKELEFAYHRVYESKSEQMGIFHYLQNLNTETAQHVLPLHILVNRDGSLYQVLRGSSDANVRVIEEFVRGG